MQPGKRIICSTLSFFPVELHLRNYYLRQPASINSLSNDWTKLVSEVSFEFSVSKAAGKYSMLFRTNNKDARCYILGKSRIALVQVNGARLLLLQSFFVVKNLDIASVGEDVPILVQQGNIFLDILYGVSRQWTRYFTRSKFLGLIPSIISCYRFWNRTLSFCLHVQG